MKTCGGRGLDGRDCGQSTVEFALVLPLVAVVLGLVVQTTAVAAARLRVVDEARRAARAASLAEDPPAAARAALASSESSVDVSFDDDVVTVVVSRVVDTDAPLVGRFTPSIEVRSELTMAREPTM